MTCERAYYHCETCRQGHVPFDQANGLQADRLSSGLRPLVCLTGILDSFRPAAADLVKRLLGVSLSGSTVRRVTHQQGERLQQKQRQGQIPRPTRMKPWDFTVQGHSHTAAYLGLDAFSVPMQASGGGKADHRMLYVGTLYNPDKSRHFYVVDFDLDEVVSQMRVAARTFHLGRANQVMAISDGGNGLEEALRRHFWEDLLCILDWYHASEHVHAYANQWGAGDAVAARAWAEQAKGLLYNQGGKALRAWLDTQEEPADVRVADELRKLRNYIGENEHRTDYPEYRKQGWDIGSGPTEAACKVVGARLKGSGRRWLEEGAEKVAPLRALYESGSEVWDAFWSMAL